VPEFFRGEFKSKIADLKNSVKDRANAQSSCAAQFVAEHLGDFAGQWLHVDLAGPSDDSSERATGFGVASCWRSGARITMRRAASPACKRWSRGCAACFSAAARSASSGA
jgi:leucyl aminopeptidase